MSVNLSVVREKHNAELCRDRLKHGNPPRVSSNLRKLPRLNRRHDVVKARLGVGDSDINRAPLAMPRPRARRFAPN